MTSQDVLKPARLRLLGSQLEISDPTAETHRHSGFGEDSACAQSGDRARQRLQGPISADAGVLLTLPIYSWTHRCGRLNLFTFQIFAESQNVGAAAIECRHSCVLAAASSQRVRRCDHALTSVPDLPVCAMFCSATTTLPHSYCSSFSSRNQLAPWLLPTASPPQTPKQAQPPLSIRIRAVPRETLL